MEQTTKTSSSKKKTNGYSHIKSDMRQDAKNRAADNRQLDHEELSVQDKIAKSKTRRGESKRELARLTKQLGAK